MGNVNGRVDGDGSSSGSGSGLLLQEEEEEEEEDDGDEILGGPLDPPLIAHSPPHSPRRAAKSPLKFAPQNPVAPIQKPDELHMSHPWVHASPGPEDMSCEQGIPTMITWNYGGKSVAVEGSWNNWKTRKPLQRSGKDFTLMKVLPSGVYQYRFIVDGTWRYAPDIPWIQDDAGNYYNVLDLQDYVPEDTESVTEFEGPQSPDCSYDNTQLNQEEFAKEPPLVPPHLNMTLLNVVPWDGPPTLSRPQHVVLNHLYMQKGKSGPSVVALGSTHRFKSKYITVVLYKSLSVTGS